MSFRVELQHQLVAHVSDKKQEQAHVGSDIGDKKQEQAQIGSVKTQKQERKQVQVHVGSDKRSSQHASKQDKLLV